MNTNFEGLKSEMMNEKFKIYTKTGDDGTSGLIGGTRVKKSDARLEAYGTVDELNSWIGLLRTENDDTETNLILEAIQNRLFLVGSHLATDTSKSDLRSKLPCDSSAIDQLEQEIDRLQNLLPPISHFILPGGSPLSAKTHITRTVCRRAERRITALEGAIDIEKQMITYINRLSDYLFVLSRFFNFIKHEKETFWMPQTE